MRGIMKLGASSSQKFEYNAPIASAHIILFSRTANKIAAPLEGGTCKPYILLYNYFHNVKIPKKKFTYTFGNSMFAQKFSEKRIFYVGCVK
jgi:hypothetical protein